MEQQELNFRTHLKERMKKLRKSIKDEIKRSMERQETNFRLYLKERLKKLRKSLKKEIKKTRQANDIHNDEWNIAVMMKGVGARQMRQLRMLETRSLRKLGK